MNPAGHVAFAAYEANDSISSRDSRDERVLVASSMQTYPHQRRYAAQVQRPGLQAPTERERDSRGHARTHRLESHRFRAPGHVTRATSTRAPWRHALRHALDTARVGDFLRGVERASPLASALGARLAWPPCLPPPHLH